MILTIRELNMFRKHYVELYIFHTKNNMLKHIGTTTSRHPGITIPGSEISIVAFLSKGIMATRKENPDSQLKGAILRECSAITC